MSDSVQPQRWQPTRLPRPWGSPGKNTGVGCHFLLQCVKVKSESEVAQSTLSDPMDCSLTGSPVHGIFQARVLEWGAIAFSEWTWVSANSRRQWRRGKCGVLQSMGLQRVGHDIATEAPPHSNMKSTAVQDNSQHTGAGIKWTVRKSYWLEEGEDVGDGRPEGSSAIGDGRKAAISSHPALMAQVPCRNQMHVYIFETITWMFLCREFTII